MRSAFAPTSPSDFAANVRRSSQPAGPAPADPELARLFSDLRMYLGLPVAQVAQHVATHPNVIAALEAGRIDLLPPWSEAARIVTAYVALAGLDPRPALDRLSLVMGVAIQATPPHPQMPRAVVRPTPDRDDHATPVSRILARLSNAATRAREQAAAPTVLAEWSSHLKETVDGLAATVRTVRAPVRWVSAAALALIILGSAAPSGVLQASVGGISKPISGLWQKLSGQSASIRVIVRDGLKWIEADDPRERRSDKLPSRRS